VAGTVQTAAPAAEPITLAEAKAWLRVDGTDEDTLITALIAAARTHVENFTRRALITQQFEVSFDAFQGASRWVGREYIETRGVRTRNHAAARPAAIGAVDQILRHQRHIADLFGE
jgi:uncharacterized phiE125 gp8 family phage protein